MRNRAFPTVRPQSLRPGDRIAVIAPSGAVNEQHANACVELIESMGFRVHVAETLFTRRGYLAGSSDWDNAQALMNAFSNKEIQGIICARGGYGATRILPHIDWNIIRDNPKFFCGFSDITALHLAINRQCNLITFHGGALPVPKDNDEARKWNQDSMYWAMTNGQPHDFIEPPSGAPKTETIVEGIAEGILDGGNLTLIASLCGTPWQPNFKNRLLVLEDVNEAPYRIDRMLTQLLQAQVLDGVRGVIFGNSPTCEDRSSGVASERLTLREVISDRLANLEVPIVYGFPCGHTDYRATLPLGVSAQLDATAGTLTLKESAHQN